eukprot:74627-Chlamydomonas_euryale.AAC.12
MAVWSFVKRVTITFRVCGSLKMGEKYVSSPRLLRGSPGSAEPERSGQLDVRRQSPHPRRFRIAA